MGPDIHTRYSYQIFIPDIHTSSPPPSRFTHNTHRGQVVGVNTAIFTNTGTSAGVGFAIPINTVKRVVPQLIEYGQVIAPSLNVQVGNERGDITCDGRLMWRVCTCGGRLMWRVCICDGRLMWRVCIRKA